MTAIARRFLLAVVALACGAAVFGTAPAPAVDPSRLAAMRYRLLGPARGGRSTAVAGVPSQPHTFYLGTSGGLWKSVDAGTTWANVSDGFFASGSIGAVAVAPSDPNVVYAGTGQGCLRGNVAPGVGVYRSADAGKTWTHAGLSDVGQIARVRVDPRNERARDLRKRLDELLARLSAAVGAPLQAFNDVARTAGAAPVTLPKRPD